MSTRKCEKCGESMSRHFFDSSTIGPCSLLPLPQASEVIYGRPTSFSEACSADHVEPENHGPSVAISGLADRMEKINTGIATYDAGVELQLLFVVMGDWTIMKVEKGNDHSFLRFTEFYSEKNPNAATYSNISLRTGAAGPLLLKKPFSDIRAAVDALADEKPLPRIDRFADDYYVLSNKGYANGIGGVEQISREVIDALSELAGKPLPIWTPKKGEWMNICKMTGATAMGGNPAGRLPEMEIWRYVLRRSDG